MTVGRDLIEVDLAAKPPGRDMWVGFHPDLKAMPGLCALLDFPLHR